MESEIDELVAKFCGVTTANPEQAQFFLESTEWHLEPALQLFFDSDATRASTTVMNLEDYDLTEDENMAMHISDHATVAPLKDSEETWEPIPPEAMAAAAAATDPPLPSKLRGTGSGRRSASALMDNDAWESIPPEAMAAPPPSKLQESCRRASSAARLVTTLRDLGKHHDSDSDSDGQEYYTGGEKSGMVVQDPAKKMKHGPARPESAVVRAQDSGSGVAEAPRLRRFLSGSSRSRQQPEQAAVSPPLQAAAASAPIAAAVAHTVHFWRNGFTVNEGPLRRMDDVSNMPFLESISRSECPRELQSTDRNIPVTVNLVKRIAEDCPAPAPEPKYVPFKGLGRTLGTKPVTLEERIAPSVDAPRSSQALTVDDASPVTSIQLRLLDGTRMVARFNTTHTVADIRGVIDAARPASSGNYQLQTMGFPPVKLTNLKQTIEGAGLLNAVVIQKG